MPKIKRDNRLLQFVHRFSRSVRRQWETWVFVAALLVSVPALIWVPRWLVNAEYGPEQATKANEYATLVDNYRKTFVQVVGGLLVFGTFAIGFQQLKITRKTHITDRFTRAIALLSAIDAAGNKQDEQRLGGIYALERIAKESPDDYWPIMEILATYMRQNLTNYSRASSAKDVSSVGELPERVPPSKEAQAIMTVLRRRKHSLDEGTFNLSDLNLGAVEAQELVLNHAKAVRSNLKGANLAKAALRGVRFETSDLSHANLMEANLEMAFLKDANLDRAFLAAANMLGVLAFDATLRGANLQLADLRAAKLDRAQLQEATLQWANLEAATLNGAQLAGADLSDTNVTQHQISTAIGDSTTKLPDGLTIPTHWPRIQND